MLGCQRSEIKARAPVARPMPRPQWSPSSASWLWAYSCEGQAVPPFRKQPWVSERVERGLARQRRGHPEWLTRPWPRGGWWWLLWWWALGDGGGGGQSLLKPLHPNPPDLQGSSYALPPALMPGLDQKPGRGQRKEARSRVSLYYDDLPAEAKGHWTKVFHCLK